MLIAGNTDGLQILLCRFNLTTESFNIVISASKSKCMTTSKAPIRISGYGDVKAVRQSTTKATSISACLDNTIWRNKYINVEVKSKMYNSVIRPMISQQRKYW